METFVARYRSAITATLSGFDRLVFRGTLRGLVMKGGMQAFLNSAGVRLLDFKQYVLTTSERVKDASLRVATAQQRPIRYLESARLDKEALARQLLREQPIEQGLICAFRTVEPCMSFEYHRSAEPRERGLRLRPRKCLHIYQYFLHPVFGFMSARLQTWFPFNIQICLNGRECVAHQLGPPARAPRAPRLHPRRQLLYPAGCCRSRQSAVFWTAAEVARGRDGLTERAVPPSRLPRGRSVPRLT